MVIFEKFFSHNILSIFMVPYAVFNQCNYRRIIKYNAT